MDGFTLTNEKVALPEVTTSNPRKHAVVGAGTTKRSIEAILQPQQIRLIQQTFHSDRLSLAQMSFASFREYAKAVRHVVGNDVPDKPLVAALDSANGAKDKKLDAVVITFDGFVGMTQQLVVVDALSADELAHSFQLFTGRDSVTISLEQFVHGLGQIGLPQHGQLGALMFDQADADGNQELDVQEFIGLVRSPEDSQKTFVDEMEKRLALMVRIDELWRDMSVVYRQVRAINPPRLCRSLSTQEVMCSFSCVVIRGCCCFCRSGGKSKTAHRALFRRCGTNNIIARGEHWN